MRKEPEGKRSDRGRGGGRNGTTQLVAVPPRSSTSICHDTSETLSSTRRGSRAPARRRRESPAICTAWQITPSSSDRESRYRRANLARDSDSAVSFGCLGPMLQSGVIPSEFLLSTIDGYGWRTRTEYSRIAYDARLSISQELAIRDSSVPDILNWTWTCYNDGLSGKIYEWIFRLKPKMVLQFEILCLFLWWFET